VAVAAACAGSAVNASPAAVAVAMPPTTLMMRVRMKKNPVCSVPRSCRDIGDEYKCINLDGVSRYIDHCDSPWSIGAL
jgi:hypothetical protein